MIPIPSRWFIVPGVAVAVVAVLFAEPKNGPVRDTGLETPAVSSDPSEREAARYHRERQQMFAQRIDYKESLMNDLIAGKTSLAAVADEFLRMNRDLPITMTLLVVQYPDCSDEEVSARNVMEFVRMRIDAETGEAVLARLKAEFRTLHGREYCSLN